MHCLNRIHKHRLSRPTSYLQVVRLSKGLRFRRWKLLGQITLKHAVWHELLVELEDLFKISLRLLVLCDGYIMLLACVQTKRSI